MSYKYPNVIFDFGMRVDPDVVVGVHPMMADLIDVLAVKYSCWQFVGIAGSFTGEDRKRIEARRFKVLDDSNPRKEVGDLDLQGRYNRNRGHQTCYAIYNNRIAQHRERGHKVVTADKKLALKTVAEFFTPEPIGVRLHNLQQYATSAISRVVSRRTADMHLGVAAVLPHMQEFVYNRWDQFAATVPENVVEDVRRIKRLHEEIDALERLQVSKHKESKLLTVLIERDKYAVLHDGRVSALDVDEVPQEMKRAIGMLKLSEVGTVLPEVGVRVSDNAFFIRVPEEVQLGS